MTSPSEPQIAEFPLRSFIGMEINTPEPGIGIASAKVCDDLLNPNGVVHGGVIFTMVDTSMGAAALSVIDDTKICASIDINVQFLRPVTSGEIIVETKVLRAGRRVVHMSSVATTAAGEAPVATAAGAFAVLEQG